MTGPFSIGAVTHLRVAPDGFDGWDYPEFTTTHRRLDNGTGTVGNEVVQSGSSVPARRARVAGNFIDRTDLATIRGYNQSKAIVVFTDDHGDAVNCIVNTFGAVQVWPGYWTFDMDLIAQ